MIRRRHRCVSPYHMNYLVLFKGNVTDVLQLAINHYESLLSSTLIIASLTVLSLTIINNVM